jgi:hypothetical protein
VEPAVTSSPAAEPLLVDDSADQAVDDVDELGDDEGPPRWVGFVTSIGLGLTVVLTAQVLAAIAEGMALKRTEPQGLEGDIFHRIGYAFSSLGGTALLFLVVAVVLVSLPVMLKARTTDRQETMAAVTLGLSVVMAIVVGIGSILTVRYNLHLYSASRRSVPSFVRIQLVFFLLGALGTAAIALFAALSALGLRDRDGGESRKAKPGTVRL